MNDSNHQQQQPKPPLYREDSSEEEVNESGESKEQEATITSTSCDPPPAAGNFGSVRGGEDHLAVTSPARITSSSGTSSGRGRGRGRGSDRGSRSNDQSHAKTDETAESSSSSSSSSSSPAAAASSEEESLSQSPLRLPTTSAAAGRKQQQQQEEEEVEHQKNRNLNGINTSEPPGGDMEPASVGASDSGDGSSGSASPSIALDGGPNVALASNASSGTATTAISCENPKIILKLPKQNASAAAVAIAGKSNDESHTGAEHNAVASSSSPSTTTSTTTTAAAGEDTRKVEPLKINLHHSHHHHHHATSSSHHSSQSGVVPKITIKPIVKKPHDAITSDCSTSADEEVMTAVISATATVSEATATATSSPSIPKLTIKTQSQTLECLSVSDGPTQPHIIPKLTIRGASAGSDEGTSVVPKLTIKMSENPASSSAHSPSPPPPLPKLTIKTSMDGTSESIISSISPAALTALSISTSSSSSSSASSPGGQNAGATATATIPKLTIKTNAAGGGACVTHHESSDHGPDDGGGGSGGGGGGGNKIPKLTIKTGQEHAVIITTQHNDTANSQTVPKLTIKTKSLEVEDASSDPSENSCRPPPEKIPKITIKATETNAASEAKFCIKSAGCGGDGSQTVPKLTISMANLEGSSSTPHSPKQSSLVVRQVPGSSSTSSRKTESPDRLPKLMISRSQEPSVNHCEGGEKIVPKLTIKTTNIVDHHHALGGESAKEKPAKFAIATSKSSANDSEEKIPKLTIKSMNAAAVSSEDSDECLSSRSSPSPLPVVVPVAVSQVDQLPKVVPKLTIKNLSSPKLKMKAVLEDPSAAATATATVTMASTAEEMKTSPPMSKKSTKCNDNAGPVVDGAIPTLKGVKAAANHKGNLVNGGGCESSNSQEFCGFNDNSAEASRRKVLEDLRRNSDDMDIDEGLQKHDPQVFNNVTYFSARNGNGEGKETVTTRGDREMAEAGAAAAAAVAAAATTETKQGRGRRVSHIIDTVDLTSSPSPGSSPAHFNFVDANQEPSGQERSMMGTAVATAPGEKPMKSVSSSSSMLLECLQRKTSVIQSATTGASLMGKDNLLLGSGSHTEAATIASASVTVNNTAKYPHLTERLLANGMHASASASALASASASASGQRKATEATVIDSIEILDTPEGSLGSSLDATTNEDFNGDGAGSHHGHSLNNGVFMPSDFTGSSEIFRCNNNTLDQSLLTAGSTHHHIGSKRTRTTDDPRNRFLQNDADLEHECLDISPSKMRRIENNANTMATLTVLTDDQAVSTMTTSPTIIGVGGSDLSQSKSQSRQQQSQAHRSRKQRHEHLLTIPIDEEDPLQINSNDAIDLAAGNVGGEMVNDSAATVVAETAAPVVVVAKKRGRPKKNPAAVAKLPSTPSTVSASSVGAADETPGTDGQTAASRRVQLLRKRLAIDMVAAEKPTMDDEDLATVAAGGSGESSAAARGVETPRRERGGLRASRRSVTPSTTSSAASPFTTEKVKRYKGDTPAGTTKGRNKVVGGGFGGGLQSANGLANTTVSTSNSNDASVNFNHFGGSNSSISSACSSNSSMNCTTLTTSMGSAMSAVIGPAVVAGPQIDLTTTSSSSSCSSNATTTTVTISSASGVLHQNNCSNSMLPPATILSSSDPVPDVVFKPNDFSSIILGPKIRSPLSPSASGSLSASMDRKVNRNNNDGGEVSADGEDSEDDSASSSSTPTTSCRGRGRGRGGRGARGGTVSGRGPRAHRLGRGASAVAKAIAMSRPRFVGAHKHMPDPERLKGLFSPSPQVFEEDTRMSADFSQSSSQQSEPQTPLKQDDFLNNDESQSSVVSTGSNLGPNFVKDNSAIKRPKKKKMEVCVADEAEFTVASIAEYEWPPPKGCCPAKNRDMFMIQEQVALYLGIKSFKRKYPDLPRRQIDMEERNYLQEKALVSEKMCDLGITAVWASDILDIMYTDFYDKYEEYKDFARQKHLREIEAKQKALGLNVGGRGLKARDRAMLSASKWNAFFNRTRKEERAACLDLQTHTVNVPLPSQAPITTLVVRPIADAVALAIEAEKIPAPPTLLPPRKAMRSPRPETSYPLALIEGQYAENVPRYTPMELRCFPLNTVLEDPCTIKERFSANRLSVPNDAVSPSRKRLAERRGRREASALPTDNEGGEENTTATLGVETETASATATATSIKAEFCSIDDSSSSEDGSSESDSDSDDSSCSSSTGGSSSSDDEASSALASCAVCQRPQNRNAKNLPEVFIECYTCLRKVHPSCIQIPHRMVARIRNYNWQCADCKCCITCKQKKEDNKMLYCVQCDRGYHIYCLGLKGVPNSCWSCDRCAICMRCGATKPEGKPELQQQQQISPTGEKVKPIKHKKVKWINEFRIDHITKVLEHCSILCVPCGRAKTTKRQPTIASHHGVSGGSVAIGGNHATTSNNANSSIAHPPPTAGVQLQQQQQQQQPQHQQQQITKQHHQQLPTGLSSTSSAISLSSSVASAGSVGSTNAMASSATATVSAAAAAATPNTIQTNSMAVTNAATNTATGLGPPPPPPPVVA